MLLFLSLIGTFFYKKNKDNYGIKACPHRLKLLDLSLDDGV